MIWLSKGGPDVEIKHAELKTDLFDLFDRLGDRKKVLVIPPDITRIHSGAGAITALAWEYYGSHLKDILPALGTHYAMTPEEIRRMFGEVPDHLFREHDWRKDLIRVGTVPEEFIRRVSEGLVSYPLELEVNRLVIDGGHDLILSIGQVVPHEVIGMANYNKNIFVGTGGAGCINKSHFLGAAFGMERMMGRADTPVRKVLDYGSDNFIHHVPIVYILTVVGTDDKGNQVLRGVFAGDDRECFESAAALSLQVNFTMLEEPPETMVVYLDPEEYRSTWLGNKSIYRTRMAIADGGRLIVLAPGLKEFGEDPEIDRLIRKYGYPGRREVLRLVETEEDLKQNLGAAAHMIHGSSDGRFRIIYCPGGLTRQEIEKAGYEYGDVNDMIARYGSSHVRDGWNIAPDGERVYYISNPALGLWANRARFD